jgi:competence protein ComEA
VYFSSVTFKEAQMKKLLFGLVLFFASIGAVAQQAPALVDLNVATFELVNGLPGIGNKLAAEIVKNRPYSSLDDLNAKVKISKKSLEKIRPLVSFGGAPAAAATPSGMAAPVAAATTPSGKPAQTNIATTANPVNVNMASKEQLMTIPQVGATLADAIIANRPYKDMAEMVKKVKGIGPKNSVKLAPFVRF